MPRCAYVPLLTAVAWGALLSASAAAQETGAGLASPPSPEGAERVAPSDRAPPTADDGHEVPPPPTGDGADTPDAPADDEVPPPPSSSRYPTSSDSSFPQRSASPETDVQIPSRTATRLRVLNANLNALASRGGSGIVDGVLSILTGGLTITLGVLLKDEAVANYLYVWGSANVARGIVDLALTPDASEPAIAFAHMPMGNMDEVEERLQFGEQQLERLANRSRLSRILDGSLNVGVGVAVVPLYLGPNNFEFRDFFDYFVVIGSGISVISGVINLVTRSEAEKRWDAYLDLRERLEEEEAERAEAAGSERNRDAARTRSAGNDRDRHGFRATFGAAPMPGGAGAVFTARF